MALFDIRRDAAICLESEVNRKWLGHARNDADDPTATSLDRPWEYRKDAPVNRAEGALMQSKMAPWAFVLAVPDINKSAEYFRDFLGFRR